MLEIFKNGFFTSGWEFTSDEHELKNQFQMMNVGIVLSSTGVLYGILTNYFSHIFSLMSIEVILLSTNILMFIALRLSKKVIDLVANLVTFQFTFLILYLIYNYEPSQMKHVWIYTYPIIFLYFRNKNIGFLWVGLMIIMILVAPLQPFYPVQYSFNQSFYLSFVFIIVSLIVYLYQQKMNEAKRVILSQQHMLEKKIEELTQKDKLLTIQSKQAVMGEMISMIAHQWRQPLSTVTLSISNLQVKKLLGEKLDNETIDKALNHISETIVYLSETIDDFQTYFHPNKEIHKIEVNELIKKTINFVVPRLKNTKIEIIHPDSERIVITTYTNEIIQVLLNILNNAVDEHIKHEKEGAFVMISVENYHEELIIDIKDNAGGINRKNLDKIFEPYFSTKGKNGTGLGLYMSQMIMQKQFGTFIDVQTNGNGTIFSIRVPKKLA
ncbi:sensor histidine kinase [Sulfurimonas sp.]